MIKSMQHSNDCQFFEMLVKSFSLVSFELFITVSAITFDTILVWHIDSISLKKTMQIVFTIALESIQFDKNMAYFNRVKKLGKSSRLD